MATRDRSRSPPARAPPRRILVTGAAGLLGQSVVEELTALGACVVACDAAPRPPGQAGEYVQCDLADAPALERACASCEAVLHLGGISGPGFVFDPPIPPATVARTNITGTLNVLEAARACGAKRVVYASSVIVYWPVDREKKWNCSALSESAPVDSTETYGASKIASEQLCRAYSAQGFVDTVSLRLGWVYGPRRRTACFVRGMLQGDVSATPAGHCRDWLYIDDASHALVLAVLRGENFGGMALNVSGAHVPHSAVVGAVERARGKKVERAPDPAALDPLLPPMDLSRACKELGWQPQVPISEGVWKCAEALGVASAAGRDLESWLGLWRWDAEKCVRAFEYYRFWGTLSDEEARQCAASKKDFEHREMSEGRLSIRFQASDTTRDVEFAYDVLIDGQPHDIDPLLRSRANNSIKMNPTGQWSHWWQGDKLIMEQPCVVRGEELFHRVTREVHGDALLCHELVALRATGEERVSATMAFKRTPRE